MIGAAWLLSSGVYAQENGSLAHHSLLDTRNGSDSITRFFASYHQSTQVRTLHLFSMGNNFFQNRTPEYQQIDHVEAYFHNDLHNGDIKKYSESDYKVARKILFAKWRKTPDDPETLTKDIDEIARYIASQPETFLLLKSLRKQPLRLSYGAGEFKSEVKGSHFFVNSVTVYFDPRKAALLSLARDCSQGKAHCVVSPVDALIHELLHAKIALLDSKAFIKSGALNSAIYPYAHELEVLGLERDIYRSMTSHDQIPRPSRRTHSGQLLDAACVTCIGS